MGQKRRERKYSDASVSDTQKCVTAIENRSELFFTTFEVSVIFEASHAVLKIGSSQEPNQLNKVWLVQIRSVTHLKQ